MYSGVSRNLIINDDVDMIDGGEYCTVVSRFGWFVLAGGTHTLC